jgi:hypothetical protein
VGAKRPFSNPLSNFPQAALAAVRLAQQAVAGLIAEPVGETCVKSNIDKILLNLRYDVGFL